MFHDTIFNIHCEGACNATAEQKHESSNNEFTQEQNYDQREILKN